MLNLPQGMFRQKETPGIKLGPAGPGAEAPKEQN